MTLYFDLIPNFDLILTKPQLTLFDLLDLDFGLTIFASELRSLSGVMRGFQKGITLGGRNSESVIFEFAKKHCKIFASEMRSKSGVIRGFQKGMTLCGRISGVVNQMSLQNRVAKNLQNFCI